MSGARGEARLQSGEQEITILFTNRALAEVEQQTGKSVLQLAQAASGDALGMGTVAQLLAAGMEYARRDARTPGPRVTLKDAYEVLDQLGFVRATVAVCEALGAVLSYGADEAIAQPDPS